MQIEHPFSRFHGCRVSDALTYCGFRAVVMENGGLRVVILPEKGAEIYSLVYKPHDCDVLFKRDQLRYMQPYPAAQVNTPGGFMESYAGGWQELFPSGGDSCQVGGMLIGTHGEVCLLPWCWQILEDTSSRVVVKFWVHLMHMPVILERVMILEEGKSHLRFEETLFNESAESLPYMWGHHPAFGAPFLDASCVLDAPASSVVVHSGVVDSHRLIADSSAGWPVVTGRNGQEIDLRNLLGCESQVNDMFYLTGLSSGWFALTNRNLGFGCAFAWDVKTFPVLWVWQEFCGSRGYPWYSKTYALGLEPFTSFATTGGSGLAEVMRAGRERWLAPHEKVQTTFQVILYPSGEAKGVAQVSKDGSIEFFKVEER